MRDDATPELALIYEILRRAVLDVVAERNAADCVAMVGKEKRELAQRAIKWLEEPGEREIPFSAAWCCAQLDIDRDKILQYLRSNPTYSPNVAMGRKRSYGLDLAALYDEDDYRVFEFGNRRKG